MKLYRSLSLALKRHVWTGTQADAKVAQTANGKFETVEVPTSKPELLAWLNEREEQIQFARAIAGMGSDVASGLQDPPVIVQAAPEPEPPQEPVGEGRCPRCLRTAIGHHMLKQGDIATAITEAIFELDQTWTLKNIAEALREHHARLAQKDVA